MSGPLLGPFSFSDVASDGNNPQGAFAWHSGEHVGWGRVSWVGEGGRRGRGGFSAKCVGNGVTIPHPPSMHVTVTYRGCDDVMKNTGNLTKRQHAFHFSQQCRE